MKAFKVKVIKTKVNVKNISGMILKFNMPPDM